MAPRYRARPPLRNDFWRGMGTVTHRENVGQLVPPRCVRLADTWFAERTDEFRKGSRDRDTYGVSVYIHGPTTPI